MPQAPQELRDEWPDDGAAWDALRGKYDDDRGIIRPKKGHAVTDREWGAIQYLCWEWDYGFDPAAIVSSVTAIGGKGGES